LVQLGSSQLDLAQLGLAWLGLARLSCIQPIAFEEFDHMLPAIDLIFPAVDLMFSAVLWLLHPLLGLDFGSTPDYFRIKVKR